MPDATSPHRAAPADAEAGRTASPSGARPIDSGPRRTTSHANGASPATSATPTVSQAVRQPRDWTMAPTRLITDNALCPQAARQRDRQGEHPERPRVAHQVHDDAERHGYRGDVHGRRVQELRSRFG